jgi:hypothetical protein
MWMQPATLLSEDHTRKVLEALVPIGANAFVGVTAERQYSSMCLLFIGQGPQRVGRGAKGGKGSVERGAKGGKGSEGDVLCQHVNGCEKSEDGCWRHRSNLVCGAGAVRGDLTLPWVDGFPVCAAGVDCAKEEFFWSDGTPW